jgi:UPF0755 protein
MHRVVRVLLLLLLIGGLAAAIAIWRASAWLQTPIAALRTPVVFEVPRGASLRAVAADLDRRGLLDHREIWIVWARLTRQSGGLKAGEYELPPGLTPQGLLQRLSSGQVLLHSITFIEGSRFAEMRKLLADNTAVKATLGATSAEEIMRALGEPNVHPEGQFFPDTYHFPRGTTDIELLAMAHRRMKDELQSAWDARAADLPLATRYEALILASVVEKETALDSERPLIAGVFVERLKRGMRLQTDPTVIYGIGDSYDGNIRRADLLRDTPYNTYTRSGLPPTPIALPGADSLRAAVQPRLTGALFFVATGKPDGSHFFSATLAEHEAAVQQYLRQLRQQSRQAH